MKKIMTISFLVILFTSLFISIYLLSTNWPSGPAPIEATEHFKYNDAKEFIDHGYPEIKDLSTRMLTLLTAILVFSVAFSEKIINYRVAESNTKIFLIISWVLLVLAIISDGFGIAFNALSLPFAIGDVNSTEDGTPSATFYVPASNSILAILISGMCFILSLFSLVLAGILSIINSHQLNGDQKAENSAR